MKLPSANQSQLNLSLKPPISLSKIRISYTTLTNSGNPSITVVNDFCALRSDWGTKTPYQDSGSPQRTGFFFGCGMSPVSEWSNGKGGVGAPLVTPLPDSLSVRLSDDARSSVLPVSIPY